VQERFGGTLFVVGGPEEREATVAVARGLKKAHLDLAGQTTIPQLVSLLARMDLMIANDTGPLHIAVALGRPVVAPYTCTRIELTGPYGAEQGAVSTKVWCAGSLKKSCSRMECMSELLPEQLWPSVEEALNRWCVQRHSA
jgi:ADP-heptose:LPS heptosyltransferase